MDDELPWAFLWLFPPIQLRARLVCHGLLDSCDAAKLRIGVKSTASFDRLKTLSSSKCSINPEHTADFRPEVEGLISFSYTLTRIGLMFSVDKLEFDDMI